MADSEKPEAQGPHRDSRLGPPPGETAKRDGNRGDSPDGSPQEVRLPDPELVRRTMTDIAERSQRIMLGWLKRQSAEKPGATGSADPFNIGAAFIEMTTRLMSNPARLMQAQMGLWQDYMALWQNTTRRIMGMESEPVIQADPRDRRFKDGAWQDNEIFDFIKQSYLLSARFVQDVVRDVDGMEPKVAQKVDFYSRQFVDALSPSNFVLTNPEVLRKTVETGGENLLKGLTNLLTDLEQGRGKLRIRMTDTEAFKLGENIATTPGKVVWQTPLMQLIQYAPTTETVLKRPLLIIPPWINKFYILDLRAKNSFVRWAAGQGHTVFMVSWVNPNEELAAKDFGDYMQEGILAALDGIEAITGEKAINAIGYCLGGTLLASTLAWMAVKKDRRIRSATYLVTLLDFAEAGELGVFIDEQQIQALEEKMNKRGYLEGAEMAQTFNMLRANDLIWSFVVNNYLLGNEPFPFDLLYWNSDSTRMPAAMHSFYLRNMYQQNLLKEPGGIALKDVPIDLSLVNLPTYMLAAREDHITPWKSTYRGLQYMKGTKRFVLAASGHIAGVVNSPDSGKYSHWVATSTPSSPESWEAVATEMSGSWWPDWQRWVSRLAAERVPAREPGSTVPPIEDAPGSYVSVMV